MAPTTPSKTKVVTGKVRLSYVHLFERYKGEDEEGEGKYSCTILIPKGDTVTLGKIDEAIKAAAEAGKTKHFDGRVPANLKTTLHDGDDEDVLAKNPEYAGCMYMSITSKTKPGVVDKDRQHIMDSEEIYSGAYAIVSMNAFAYSAKGNKGVSFGLNHVMKVADGDFLGGRSRAEDDFADVQVELDDEDLESLI